MTRRVYIVGTDTGVGKTTLACALLRRATELGIRAVPFKPAQSGDDEPSDIARLLAAADLPASLAPAACPHRFDPPLAPGLAEDPSAFIRSSQIEDLHAVATARATLDTWIERQRPDLVLVEGAGGLHVPMPGPSWQTAWIRALSDIVVVVGRAGLGTINHTLLTIDALRHLDLAPRGFYLCDPDRQPDPSQRDNASVIAAARSLPHLGTLPHMPTAPAKPPASLLTELLRVCDDDAGRR